MNWELIISAAITGGIFGTLGSLIAPWINWGVEKKRMKVNRRIAMIDQLRKSLDSMEEYDNRTFTQSAIYSNIRPYLDRKLMEYIEREDVIVIGGGRSGGVNNHKSKILDAVSKLEKEWGLL